MSNRVMVRTECDGCGAPLEGLECRYCGAKYERESRYDGPDIPEGQLAKADGRLPLNQWHGTNIWNSCAGAWPYE